MFLAGFDLARELSAPARKMILLPERVPYAMGHSMIVKDYRLTTAEIVYHMPDFPWILQSYVWQAMDIAPEYPELQKFLAFWRRELEGKLHSVRVAANPIAGGGRVRHASVMQTMH
jgi:uncharacterized protein Usg